MKYTFSKKNVSLDIIGGIIQLGSFLKVIFLTYQFDNSQNLLEAVLEHQIKGKQGRFCF